MTGHSAERDESAQTAPARVPSGVIAADQLRSIVERIGNLEEEKDGIASDIRDIFAESKGNGFCVKTLRKILALRKLDAAERDEAEHILDTYCVALGMKPQMDILDEPDPSGDIADKLYEQAVAVVHRDHNASTSYIQRVLKLGYNRAARLVDMMEANGIVSAPNHVGKRECLG